MNTSRPGLGFAGHPMPLDAVAAAFAWLQQGPDPIAINGHAFPGMPDRAVPLAEVRERLLAPTSPPSMRDAVWAHLVARSRAEGAEWTVGCAGMALPALIRIAATLTARFAGDPRDVHAAVLTGFLTELAAVDVVRPRIMLRLRWAAYRAGLACVREALDAPIPTPDTFTSTPPPTPSGHPDLVLARAVADGVLTAGEAELIGATRLEEVSLAEAAARRRAGYEATKKARQRAEHRLIAYLRSEALDTDATLDHPRRSDVGERNTTPAVITTAARDASAQTTTPPPSVTDRHRRRPRNTRRRTSPPATQHGVQEHPRTPTETAVSPPPDVTKGAGPSPEVSRCA